MKSRGSSHPRTIGNNTQVIQLNNKIAGRADSNTIVASGAKGRNEDNPFEIASGPKTFD